MIRILVIEDDATLNLSLGRLLSKNGYKAVFAKSERAAEEALKEPGGSIAIALVDMFMPAKAQNLNDMESGLRLIQLMTERYPSIVTVVFTGHGDLANAAKCMEAGAFSYCIKGGEPNELLDKISKAEAKYKRDRLLRDGIRGLVKEVQDHSFNLIGAVQRLSDEFNKASGD